MCPFSAWMMIDSLFGHTASQYVPLNSLPKNQGLSSSAPQRRWDFFKSHSGCHYITQTLSSDQAGAIHCRTGQRDPGPPMINDPCSL
jgi:hypothetical protein